MGAKGQKMMSVAQAVATKDTPKAKRKPTGALASVNESTKSIMETEKAYKEASAPIPAVAKLVDVGGDSGSSNFESDIKRRQKKTRTSFSGDSGGYGGNTQLG